jgi:hypothetical protein
MSDNFEVTVLDQEVAMLIARMPQRLGMVLEGTINDVSALALRELKTYPDARPESKYIRTGTLMRSWSRQITGSGLDMEAVVGSNGNMSPYNRYVQDQEEQAAIHAETWRGKTVQEIAARLEGPAQDLFQARVEAGLNQ